MAAVPLFVAGLPVVAWTTLDPPHCAAGGAESFARGEPFVPAGLAICRASNGGFYLFGCDAAWNPVTDTWHETVDARHQAEREHEGISHGWKQVD